MALYEITQDCRIANNNFSKGDVVSSEETNWYHPTVMKPVNPAQITEEKEEVKEEVKEVKETPKASAKKWQSKKK